MKKVVILYNKLFHYRISVFNILAEKYDLTFVHSEPAKGEEVAQCNFKTIYLPHKKVGKLLFQDNKIIKKIIKDADVVIACGQITYVNYTRLAFVKRDYGLIFWSIGAPASYNRHYGEASSLYIKIADVIRNRADALIFYAEKAKEMHISRGYDPNTLFVANNTVKVEKITVDPTLKQNLLFIGTFYLEKGLQELLEAYKAANRENPNVPVLKMIGGGKQLPFVKQWIEENGLSDKIELAGAIYNSREKATVFQQTIACISPKQAGLSVLESMGYAVPFITEKHAITGGESFNIHNGEDGVMMENLSELKDVLLDITNNKEKYLEMGNKAYEYYWKYRTPEIMAKGIADAIEYVFALKHM